MHDLHPAEKQALFSLAAKEKKKVRSRSLPGRTERSPVPAGKTMPHSGK